MGREVMIRGVIIKKEIAWVFFDLGGGGGRGRRRCDWIYTWYRKGLFGF